VKTLSELRSSRKSAMDGEGGKGKKRHGKKGENLYIKVPGI
jgi:GTPase involved in cell partitioning and DNA repair